MTLRTPRGVRFLKGAERTLVFEGILTLSDAVHDLGDGSYEFHSNIAVFENLEPIEKQFALLRVGQALLTDTGRRVLRRAAVFDGTIAAVYEFISTRIEVEIDFERSDAEDNIPVAEDLFDWRRMTMNAAVEKRVSCRPSRIESRNHPDWDFTLSCLLDRVLGDSDYQATYLMDSAPSKTRALMQMLGMQRDYFLMFPKIPKGETVETLRRKISTITTADSDIPF